jgi:hypothetical protein
VLFSIRVFTICVLTPSSPESHSWLWPPWPSTATLESQHCEIQILLDLWGGYIPINSSEVETILSQNAFNTHLTYQTSQLRSRGYCPNSHCGCGTDLDLELQSVTAAAQHCERALHCESLVQKISKCKIWSMISTVYRSLLHCFRLEKLCIELSLVRDLHAFLEESYTDTCIQIPVYRYFTNYHSSLGLPLNWLQSPRLMHLQINGGSEFHAPWGPICSLYWSTLVEGSCFSQWLYKFSLKKLLGYPWSPYRKRALHLPWIDWLDLAKSLPHI